MMNERSNTINNGRYDATVVELLAKYEEENMRLIQEKNEVMKDFNTRMKVHLEEIRLLKEVNERLQTDLEELRDLCCYLDDDRQKFRRLAKEWQNFGHYVSTTLESKETSYQEEVSSLNIKHETIIAENHNLKRLCHDLEERSNGLNTPREYVCIRCSQRISLESKERGAGSRKRSSLGSPTEIINHSDTEIHSTRTEGSYTDDDSPVFSPNRNIFSKDSPQSPMKTNGRKKKVSFVEPDETDQSGCEKPKHVPFQTESNGLKDGMCRGILRNGTKRSHSNSLGSTSSADSDSSANNINNAMKVLEIHSELEDGRRNRPKEPLKDQEVAVLKEMCNVVWRKLSSDGPSNETSENNVPSDDVIYEDLL